MKIHKQVTFKIIMAILFPPALFAIQFKTAKELQYMPQTQEEHEQDMESLDENRDGYNSGSEHNADIGLTMTGLKARSENTDSAEGTDPDLVGRVLVSGIFLLHLF